MKIRFLRAFNQFEAGSVAEVQDSVASKLIWRRLAERVEDDAPAALETAAVRPDTERAVLPPATVREEQQPEEDEVDLHQIIGDDVPPEPFVEQAGEEEGI